MLAHAVGLKARRIAGAVKADIASIRKDAARNASKLAQEDPQRKKVAEQAKAAEAELLQATVDLPMPNTGLNEQAQASGARKAAAAPEHDALAAAEAEVLVAEKEVKRAMAALATAEKQENEARKRALRWVAKLEAESDKSHKDPWNNEFTQAEKGARRAKARWDERELETASKEKFLLETKLDLKDAEKEVLLVELERSLEREEILRKIVDKRLASCGVHHEKIVQLLSAISEAVEGLPE